jgi:hypothetical protein
MFVKQSQSLVWFGWCYDWWGCQSWSGKLSGSILGSYHLEGVIWFLFEGITLTWDVNCSHWEGGSS